MKKLKILLVIILVVVIGGGVALYAGLGSLIKGVVETALPPITGTPVTLAGVSVSPLSGSGELKGFVMGNPEGYKTEHFFKLDAVNLSVDTSSLGSDATVINNIGIDGADLIAEFAGPGGSNFGQIMKNIDKFIGEQEKKPEEERGGKVIIKLFEMKNCKMRVSASFFGGKALALPLPDLKLEGIGEKEGGVTAEEAAKQVFSQLGPLMTRTLAANSSNTEGISRVAGEAADKAKELGTTAVEKSKEAVGKLKGLFGK